MWPENKDIPALWDFSSQFPRWGTSWGPQSQLLFRPDVAGHEKYRRGEGWWEWSNKTHTPPPKTYKVISLWTNLTEVPWLIFWWGKIVLSETYVISLYFWNKLKTNSLLCVVPLKSSWILWRAACLSRLKMYCKKNVMCIVWEQHSTLISVIC